jgi:DNA-directed RNA polymerase specialized sigma24 family protein
MLRSHHDAEDAFQATFLILVQKAATFPDPEMVGNWLYGVARQTAVRTRALAARRACASYELAGDRLKLRMNDKFGGNGEDERPVDFSTDKGKEAVLFILKRGEK